MDRWYNIYSKLVKQNLLTCIPDDPSQVTHIFALFTTPDNRCYCGRLHDL